MPTVAINPRCTDTSDALSLEIDSPRATHSDSFFAAHRDAIVDKLTERLSEVIQNTFKEFDYHSANKPIVGSKFMDVDEENLDSQVQLTSQMPIGMQWQPIEAEWQQSTQRSTYQLLNDANARVKGTISIDHPMKDSQRKVQSAPPQLRLASDDTLLPRSSTCASASSAASRNLAENDMFNVAMKDSPHASDSLDRRLGDRRRKTVTGEGIRCAEGMDLHTEFLELDSTQTGFLPVATLLEQLAIPDKFDVFHAAEVLEEAVVQINEINASVACHDGDLNTISLETFKVLMLADTAELEKNLSSPEHTRLVLEMRELCVRDKMDRKIAAAYKVKKEEVSHEFNHYGTCAETYLEPMVAIVIFVNACVIGLSLDLWRDWVGWTMIEVAFTSFFMIELVIKVSTFGLSEFALGAEWSWNWFDTAVVICALVDMGFTLIAVFAHVETINLQILTVVRLFRLLRITRLIRLLRFRMFKELNLMVNGVLNGFKTLVWAIVLLTCVIYALSVLMRQLIETGSTFTTDCGSFEPTCFQHTQWNQREFGRSMFGNVGRAMLSIFICFTDGCNAPDGTPMLWYFWDIYGSWLVLLYVFIFIFVTFGIFNLILATFVENTREAALIEQQDRIAGTKKFGQAKKLQQLLVKVCSACSGDEHNAEIGGSSSLQKSVQGLKKLAKFLRHSRKSDNVMPEAKHLNLRVNKHMFEIVMEREDIKRLLEDLDISRLSRSQLFDILDSDGNGYLAVSEIVEGIMKLRGPADKGDTISTVLMMRAFQKHMHDFEKVVLHNQRSIKKLLQKFGEDS